jgi:hypothetical protein
VGSIPISIFVFLPWTMFVNTTALLFLKMCLCKLINVSFHYLDP